MCAHNLDSKAEQTARARRAEKLGAGIYVYGASPSGDEGPCFTARHSMAIGEGADTPDSVATSTLPASSVNDQTYV
jgi:hypothetical protein